MISAVKVNEVKTIERCAERLRPILSGLSILYSGNAKAPIHALSVTMASQICGYAQGVPSLNCGGINTSTSPLSIKNNEIKK